MSAPPEQWATAYAHALLATLGWQGPAPTAAAEHPAVAWARSGLMQVTGWPNGPGLMCPAPLAAAANGAMAAFAAVAGLPPETQPNGAALLGERARRRGLKRAGATAPGGTCRLLPTRDGWLAINLPRPEDWAAVPAWLQQDVPQDWPAIAATLATAHTQPLLEQALLLGLPISRADAAPPSSLWLTHAHPNPAPPPANRRPRVVDLTALWAGPLAGRLLALAGADVIKIESTTRPDGARLGHPGHYAALNAGKRSVALNLTTQQGRAALQALLRQADIVLESTRPRALRQLGIIAEDLLAASPGAVWLSITAHGRTGPAENAIGFGDDAAAAAGLSHLMARTYGQMIFAGDAVADPLTGLHAALAALASWRQGQGGLLSLSLAGVAANTMRLGGTLDGPALSARAKTWARIAAPWANRPYPLPWPDARAAALGADTNAVLATLAVPC